jgi:hypothetical protein
MNNSTNAHQVIKNNVFSLKTLTPWENSNPDAMTTATRRHQGKVSY